MKRFFIIATLFLLSVASINGQELVKYQEAQYPGGKEELSLLVAKELRISKKLFTAMVEGNIQKVTATIGLIVNSKGQVVAIEMLQTSHSLMDETSFPKLIKTLKKETFIPGSINGEPTATMIVVKDVVAAVVPQ